jgi:hypothetical protein
MKFICLVTRTYKRPKALAALVASLEAQQDQDYEHLIIPDEIGVGIPAVNGMFRQLDLTDRATYIWVMDDDNYLDDAAIVTIRALNQGADVLIVGHERGDIVYPSSEPANGTIDIACMLVTPAVWMKHRGSYGEHYAGDWDFMSSVLSDKSLMVVHLNPFVGSYSERANHGEPE